MENKDIDLIKKIQHGSKRAFNSFYEIHIHFVFQIACHILGDRSEAEDICQEVFLEVLQKVHQYNPNKGSVKSWLAVKTKSRCLDRLRKNKTILINRLEKMALGSEKGAEIEFLDRLEKKIIIDALNHLSAEQREAIIRSYFQEETHTEIARVMKKPLGSVKSLIRYGLNNLRKQKPIMNWVESNGGERK